ncbi:MAG: hypothetical protein ABI461_05075 [Polyangiaceae bacterium]
MKGFLILAASAAVLVLAFAFALALRPRDPEAPATSSARVAEPAPIRTDLIEAAPPLVIDLAPTVIVARTPLRSRPAPARPESPTPAATAEAAVFCSGWRPLEMGEGSVQLCTSSASADDARFRRSPYELAP